MARLYHEAYRTKLHKLRADYDHHYKLLDLIARTVKSLIDDVARFSHKPAIADYRVKTLDGMRLKFAEGYERYLDQLAQLDGPATRIKYNAKLNALRNYLADPLTSMTDLIGLRYVTNYNYGTYHDAIIRLFRASDTDRLTPNNWTVDYAPKDVAHEGGPRIMGEHFVARLLPHQISFTLAQATREGYEANEAFVANMPFEIQLRTAVVHAWTIISHERLYKVDGRDNLKSKMNDLLNQALALEAGLTKVIDEPDVWLDKKMDDLAGTANAGSEPLMSADDVERLLEYPCNDTEALTAYAMFKFFDVSCYGASNAVSPLWISLCAKTLQTTSCRTIADLEEPIEHVIDSVIAYRNELRQADIDGGTDRNRFIFKDATDWLSKCLIFAMPEFRANYPYGQQTRQELERLGFTDLPQG